MHEFLKSFLSMSLAGSLLILLLFLIKPLLKNWLSKRWQYYVWLVVIGRLLFPFTPQTSPMGSAFHTINHIVTQLSVKISSQIALSDTGSAALPEEDFEKNMMFIPDFESSNPGLWDKIPFIEIFILLLFAVALLLFIQKITTYQTFVRYIKSSWSPVTDTGLLDRLALMETRAGVKKAVDLYVNPLISSPMLFGFLKPCIVLPNKDMPDTDFECVMLHELIHYRRRDLYYKWLAQGVLCLHWFNPLVHFMKREIDKACELACDEAVLSTLNSDGKLAYGHTLLNSMKTMGTYDEPPVSILLSENKKLLKERISAIHKGRKKTAFCSLITILLTINLCLGTAVLGAYAASGFSAPAADVLEFDNVGMLLLSTPEENIVIEQGGDKLKIRLNNCNDYKITDKPSSTAGLRSISLVKRDWKRSHKPGYQTIYITIPEQAGFMSTGISTMYGDISVSNISNSFFSAFTNSGSITLHNNTFRNTTLSTAKGSVCVTLPDSIENYSVDQHIYEASHLILNGKLHQGGRFALNQTAEKQLHLLQTGDASNSISISISDAGSSKTGSEQEKEHQ